MSKPRHSWSPPYRPSHHRTVRACWNCRLEKVTRHEHSRHWQEFWRDGEKFERMPSCLAVTANAPRRVG